MIQLLKHNTNLIQKEQVDSISWITAILKGKQKKYRKNRALKSVRFWLIELDEKNSKVVRSIGLGFEKRPLNETKEIILNSDINFNELKIEEVNQELFEDIYRTAGIMDFGLIVELFEKYIEKWNSSIDEVTLKFPLYFIEHGSLSFKFQSFDSLKESDVILYPIDEEASIIDSNGHILEVKYWNFGHPTGVVFPIGVKRKIAPKELENLQVRN